MLPQDDLPKHLVRYVPAATEEKLAERLNIGWHHHCQDWDIEYADADRVNEFLDAYSFLDMTDDEKFALMSLIFASLDDAVHEGSDIRDAYDRTEPILRGNVPLYTMIMSYWTSGDDPDPDYQWHITPWIRPLWKELRPQLL